MLFLLLPGVEADRAAGAALELAGPGIGTSLELALSLGGTIIGIWRGGGGHCDRDKR